MERKTVYQKTSDYIRGRWLNIILVLAGIWGINFILGLVLGGSTAVNTFSNTMTQMQNNLSDQEMVLNIADSFVKGARQNWIIGIIQGTVSSMLTAGFSMALLSSIKRDETISFEGVFDNIQKYLIEILVASLIIGVVQFVVGIIPIIGAIISAILSYMFAYVFYIIKEDENEDVVSTIRESINRTKGHKLDLFVIDLYYGFRPLLALLLIPVAILLPDDLFILTILLLIAAVIIAIVLAIRYIPYANVARTIYYTETNTFHDVNHSDHYDEFDDYDDFNEFTDD